VRAACLHLTLLAAHTLQGTASTLTRSEVRGGGKKPYKQKGTGNARRGSKRSPLMPGGGISFGPKVRLRLQPGCRRGVHCSKNQQTAGWRGCRTHFRLGYAAPPAGSQAAEHPHRPWPFLACKQR
jgi:hypothetical protein